MSWTLDSTAASTLPLNGLSAVQALDLLGLAAGQTVLVTGAAGGLGGFGVELAAMRGLRVIAAAGEDDEELVRRLGATAFVSRSANLARAVRDLVPGGSMRPSTPPCSATGPGRRTDRRLLRGLRRVRPGPAARHPHGAGLHPRRRSGPGRAVRAGRIRETDLRVTGTYPLSDAAKAHKRLHAGGLRGRLVLIP